MEEEKKITAGSASNDLKAKEHAQESAIDYGREMRKDYIKNLLEVLHDGKNKYQGDFYIVVLGKRERLLNNILRNYFFHRKSCPTATHDQTVFKCNQHKDEIELLWTVPDMETSIIFIQNAKDIIPEEMGLLKFILDFKDGTLDILAQKLNNEENYARESRTIITATS